MRCELYNPLIASSLYFTLRVVHNCCSAIFFYYRWFHLGGKCVAEHISFSILIFYSYIYIFKVLGFSYIFSQVILLILYNHLGVHSYYLEVLSVWYHNHILLLSCLCLRIAYVLYIYSFSMCVNTV